MLRLCLPTHTFAPLHLFSPFTSFFSSSPLPPYYWLLFLSIRDGGATSAGDLVVPVLHSAGTHSLSGTPSLKATLLLPRFFSGSATLAGDLAVPSSPLRWYSLSLELRHSRHNKGGSDQQGSKSIFSSNQCRDEDDDAEKLRTVECLRGRLQSERVASKEAKEVTQVIGKKLDELEKRLSGEIKSRNKAEKRLRHALKKLESLKILDLPEYSSGGSFSSYSSLATEGSDDKRSSSVKTDNDSLQCSSFEEVKEEKNGLTGSENESWCSIGSQLSLVKDDNCGNPSIQNCGSEGKFHADMRQSSVSTTSVQEASQEQVIKTEEKQQQVIVPAKSSSTNA